MKKLLNTLYVITPESYISKEGLNVVISVKQKEVFRIPIINIEHIVTFGYMGISPGVMKLCIDNGVSITLLSPSGHFISNIQGPIRGNVLLRLKQYDLSKTTEFSLQISRNIIAAKIHNYRNVLQRHLRDYGSNTNIETISRHLLIAKRRVLLADSAKTLLGIEGDAANAYFSVFKYLIRNQKDDFKFTGRNKHPPRDAVNAMLSFAYTLIASDMVAALETVGLDPYVGFFHTLRPGRRSLALDLMEELRAYLGDRLVLSLINTRQITKTDFINQTNECIYLTNKGRNTLLTNWQKRKKETIVHPYLNEKIPIGLLPYAQCQLLARYLRGDIDDYPVFINR